MRVEIRPGTTLHAEAWDGDGPPYLLVHGLSSNARLWTGVATRLAALGHRVVAVDQRGHGRSDKPDDGYDLATAVDDLVVVIERLALARPVVAGQSWGGNVALELAWRRPDLVRALVCVDGGLIELQERYPRWEDCEAVLAPPPLSGVALADVERHVRATYAGWPDDGIAAQLANLEVREDGTVAPWLTPPRHLALLRALWEHRPSARLRELQVPVVVVKADGPTSALTDEQVARAEREIPDVRVVRQPGHHDLHAEQPDKVAAALLFGAGS